MFKKQKFITREDVKMNRGTMYVFGDNMQRVGMGGQAAEMRGEPNALGIPTKHSPGIGPFDYFEDSQMPKLLTMFEQHFGLVEAWLRNGKDVVWPEDGIGTGLSELPLVAPKIHAYIEGKVKELEEEYGSGDQSSVIEEDSTPEG